MAATDERTGLMEEQMTESMTENGSQRPDVSVFHARWVYYSLYCSNSHTASSVQPQKW